MTKDETKKKHVAIEDVPDRVAKIIKEFLRDNEQDVLSLGEQAVIDLLVQETVSLMPIPTLSPQMTDEEICERESICILRDRAFADTALQQRANAEQIAHVRERAKSTALRLVNVGVSSLFGAMLGAL